MAGFPSTGLISDFFDLITAGTHVAIYTSNPGPDNTGSEASGGSYARQAITWSSVTGSAVSNTNTLEYVAMPAGTFTHWGVFDDATAGSLIAYGPLASNATLLSGDDLTVEAGDVDITFAGS